MLKIGNEGQANYAAAKAGIIGLTKTMAKEFGSRGIVINCVCPGFVGQTNMVSDIEADPAKMQAVLDRIPLHRMGTAEEVAGLVKFLALDAAAGYMTGHCINIDGGLAIGAT